MANESIKKYAKERSVKLWQIANELNMHDSNFSRLLRRELTEKEKKRIFKIIDDLSCVDFLELPPETTTMRYMSMMSDVQKQAVCACASQILLKGEEQCEK